MVVNALGERLFVPRGVPPHSKYSQFHSQFPDSLDLLAKAGK